MPRNWYLLFPKASVVLQLHLWVGWLSLPLGPEPGLKMMEGFAKKELKRPHTQCTWRGPNQLWAANSNTGRQPCAGENVLLKGRWVSEQTILMPGSCSEYYIGKNWYIQNISTLAHLFFYKVSCLFKLAASFMNTKFVKGVWPFWMALQQTCKLCSQWAAQIVNLSPICYLSS